MGISDLIKDNFPLILSTFTGLLSLLLSLSVTIWTVLANKNQDLKKIKLARRIPKVDELYNHIDDLVNNFTYLIQRDEKTKLLTLPNDKYDDFNKKIRVLQNRIVSFGISSRYITKALMNLRITFECYESIYEFSQEEEIKFYERISLALTSITKAMIKYENKIMR